MDSSNIQISSTMYLNTTSINYVKPAMWISHPQIIKTVYIIGYYPSRTTTRNCDFTIQSASST